METMQVSSPPTKARVFLVEDHPIVSEGLAILIGSEPDMTVCGCIDSVAGAIERIDEIRPDVVVVDIALGDESGLNLVKELHARDKKMPILVLSMHDETLYAERALRIGAKGYVMKNQALDTVRTAIRKVLTGEIFLSEKMVTQVLKRVVNVRGPETQSPLATLTNREFEVFKLIAQGAGPTEISQVLNVSVKTIDTHRDHIKEKLSLKSGAELRIYATRWYAETQMN